MATTLYQGVARLVGEGYDRPEGDSALALDVNFSKINEWMVCWWWCRRMSHMIRMWLG